MHSRRSRRRHLLARTMLATSSIVTGVSACGESSPSVLEPPASAETSTVVAPATIADLADLDDAPTRAAILFPLAPGETDNWKAALADLIGPRYSEYASSRARFGLTRQTTVLQRTPMGDFALISLEGPDLDATSSVMATSSDEWDVDWRTMTSGLHGTDFDDAGNLAIDVHLVLDTGDLSDSEQEGLRPFNFFIPLQADPGLKDRFDAVMETRGDEYRAARAAIGVAEEKVFLQNTPVGPGVVVHWEAADPKASLQRLLDSDDAFDVWMRGEFESSHAVPIDVLYDIVAANELIADFPSDITIASSGPG